MEAILRETAIRGVEAAQDQPRTLAQLLRSHQSMVYSLALHFLHDPAAAEEVTQDVFLELNRRMDELESDAHIVFWLRRVTSHRCIDYTRRQKHQPKVGLDEVAEPSVEGGHPDILLRRRLQALVSTLPEKPRMVMVLRYQEDMMPEEIARVLGMPVATVRSHLQRSLTMLREKVQRTLGDVR